MTIIVEDGTGKANAESYCTVAFADQYFSARNIPSWAAVGTDATKESLLRAATDYMEQVYRMRWAGARTTSTQALSWPRYAVPLKDYPGGYAGFPSYVANNVVPDAVQRACAELALRAISGPLAPDIGRIKSRTKIGPIEVDYVQGASAVTKFRAVDNMVGIYFGGSGGSSMNIPLARA